MGKINGIFSHKIKLPQFAASLWGKFMRKINGENLWGKFLGKINGEILWGKFMGKINGEN